MKIAIIFGTRPEIIKLSEIMRLFKNRNIESVFIHTGQHYSDNMSDLFFNELNLEPPKYNLNIKKTTRTEQLNDMELGISAILESEKPDLVIVQGDTNSVLSGARSAKKLNIMVAHVEAGIRSFAATMPEELNRVETDSISDYCFAPTHIAVSNLINEKINAEKIFNVGNTILEAVTKNLELTQNSNTILTKHNLSPKNYSILTLHRQENADNEERLKDIFLGLETVKEDIIFPAHPRTIKNLELFKLLNDLKNNGKIKIINPLGYSDFLNLCANAKIIFTDSGGIQEESSIYKVPCLILRENTERPEVLNKFGWLVGYNSNLIKEKYQWLCNNYDSITEIMKITNCPFGDGTASKQIVDILCKT